MHFFQSFQCYYQRTGCSTLAHCMPCVVFADLVARHKLKSNLSAVAAALSYVEAAPCDTNASSLLRCVSCFRISHCLLIDWTHGIHDLLHRILRIYIAVDILIAFTADILITELERIHAQFFCHHIHQRLAECICLRRTVASVSGTKCMVYVGYTNQTCYVRYIVREEGETCRFGHNVVTAPGVSAVVHTDIKLSCQNLSVIIASQTAVGVCRAAFAAEVLMLFIGHGQGYRLAGNYGTSCTQCDIACVGRPSEACAGRVHDNSVFILRNTEAVTKTSDGRVYTLGFTLNGQQTIIAPVRLKYTTLDGKMRLTGGGEASFYYVRCFVD